MAKTDQHLKRLFNDFIDEIAPWLLKQPVKAVSTRNIELPVAGINADEVFEVVLQDDANTLFLHIEFEAGSSVEEMKWRMLDYISRTTRRYKKKLHSVVFYLGSAGKGDRRSMSLRV
ncbi:MAG: hypothetical protein R2880_11625 [Deinococcales bacterium]